MEIFIYTTGYISSEFRQEVEVVGKIWEASAYG